MIDFIEGKVCEKAAGALVLMTGGVGFRLNCSAATIGAAPPNGETMRCQTVFSVREDAMELYGFATGEEKRLFQQLTAISGVGPKAALSILGVLSPHDLQAAIVMEDVNALCRAPGVGKKLASRILMEMKDKVDPMLPLSAGSDAAPAARAASDNLGQAIEGLMVLGYSAVEARSALQRVENPDAPVETLIAQALRAMVSM